MLLKFFASSLLSLFLVDRLLQHDVAAVEADVDITYVQLFQSGVEAYRADKWAMCINYFSRAMDDYKFYRQQITSCRRKCHAEGATASYISNVTDVENRFFEMGVKHTLCLVNCRKAHFRGRPNTYTADVDEAFEKLVPYDYLQMCYYKSGAIDQALTAAFTFLHANPGHENMQHNVDFYLKEKGAAQQDLKNREVKPYQELFFKGVQAIDAKNYQAAMDFMERSLEEYISAEEDCRVMCEGSFDQDGMQPDMYIAVANHMTYALKCRRRCHIRLQTFDGYIASTTLFSRYYFYLEEAYAGLDQTEEACHAAESYLLFNPTDEKMLKTKGELKNLPDAQEEWFTPKPEAVTYHQREKTETALLEYIEKEFGVLVKQNAEDKAQRLKLDGSPSSPSAPVDKKASAKHDDGNAQDASKTGKEDQAF
ncbi:putative Prolyl 3-hydroxylase 2 [Hypsibius exemplaris]|uniref:Prolyl 3-hydroxylase 2 n=1 Tax=Hypsibius exemplaris TaxID=2072580 RepID=A0A1W0WKL6_HYPEX|nr:putative Prolyl 3-hydroxylase 2 [Hypsibius exemplaris]